MSLALLGLISAAQAAAAPDLTTTIIQPAGVHVYQSAKWEVRVNNVGNRDANPTTLVIQLPETNTSPSVYVMGTLGAKSTSCTQSGTKLNCAVGNVKKGNQVTVFFWIALPESAGTLDFSATASTALETNTGNNGSSATASLVNYAPTYTAPFDVVNRHCTGTALEAFYECTLFPSSITSHDATLEADGTISFWFDPDYGGTWSVVGTTLTMQYTYLGAVEADFVGHGVDADCWEGLTTFPGSTYVSPYEVCQ